MSSLRRRPYIADNPHVVNQIVERDLCVRCGACEPACPVDIIRFDAQAYPYLTDEAACPTACQRCLKVCPGEEMDLAALDAEMFGMQPHPESVTGVVRGTFISFATDKAVRENGASGGFVTQLLLYLLRERRIDGALILGSTSGENGPSLRPLIARSPDEIKAAAKSKYLAVPFLRELGEIERVAGRYAVVALPCYAHALRKYQKSSKQLRERIALVIGLYCNVVFEPKLLDDLCDFSGLDRRDLVDLEFRGGSWPGGILARMRDGSVKKVLKMEEMRDEFNTLKLFYTPPRCTMCTDFSAEYADIAVGDPWLRGPDGKLLYQDGRTTVLIRTAVGEEVVRSAESDGFVKLEPLSVKTWMMNFEGSASYKRDFVPINIRLRERLRLPVPHYRRAMGRHRPRAAVSVLFRSVVLALARSRAFRRAGLALAQTSPALSFFRWNRRRKERKFSARYARMEAFTARFSHQIVQEARPPGTEDSKGRA